MYNPSALKGDLLHQRFVVAMNRINDASMSPDITANTIIETTSVLTETNNTEYLNPPSTGRGLSDRFYNIIVKSYKNEFIRDTRALYRGIGASVGVDLDINAALA